MRLLTSMGTLAFSQALDLNNIDGSSYHMYSMTVNKFLYCVQMRRTFYMHHKMIDILCITICYLSLQESIVEQYLLQDLPIYLRTMNAMIYHSHNMSLIIQPFRLDLLRRCLCIPHKHSFYSSRIFFQEERKKNNNKKIENQIQNAINKSFD